MDLEASNIVKPVRVLLSLLMVAAVLFASTSSVSAIGFDAEKAYESVFVVYSGTSLGSGFAIGENCVITNAHVITDTDNIAIVTYEGTEYAASLLGINEDEDIAVLVIENAAFSYLMMANLSAVKIGDDIYTIGAPKGMAYTLTKGTISAKERIIREKSYIQIDAAINEADTIEKMQEQLVNGVLDPSVQTTAADLIEMLENHEITLRNQEKVLEELKNFVENSKQESNEARFTIYTVVDGDTLAKICSEHGLDYKTNINIIIELNGIKDANLIYVGQKLLLPIDE